MILRPVAAALCALAAAARADDLVPPPVPVTPPPTERPADTERDLRIMTTRWQARPWTGATTLRLGGLDRFPVAAADRIEHNWVVAWDAKEDSRDATPIDFGLVHGVDVSFRLDPLVSVSARLSKLDSTRGSRVLTMTAGGGGTFRDEWEFETSMLMVMGGAGFHLPLNARTRLNVSLFVGTGLATVEVFHRTRTVFPGFVTFDEGSAVADGTSFIPEFAFEIEHDLADPLGVGASLGYRFGGIESFIVRRANSVNLVYNGIEMERGAPLRDGARALLTADYGGLVLAVYLVARI